MTASASPSTPAAPAPRRFPRWAIALIAAGVLGGLATCALVVIGVLTLLGSRVQPGPVIATDGQSQVTTPMLWARVTNLSDHATIQVAGPRQEQFLYVVTTGKSETGPITLQDYADHMVGNMRDHYGDPAISPARVVTVDGRPALRYEVDASRNGHELHFVLTYVDGTQNFYQVVAGAVDGGRARAETLTQVSDSFQEIVLAGGSGPVYDERADPSADIAAALAQAKAEQKRVLLDFGADWCPDCLVLDRHLDSPQVQPYLDEHFVVVRVYVGQWDANLDVAERYGNPIAQGIPAVVVLDADGQVVASTGGGELANARTSTREDILALLKQWARE